MDSFAIIERNISSDLSVNRSTAGKPSPMNSFSFQGMEEGLPVGIVREFPFGPIPAWKESQLRQALLHNTGSLFNPPIGMENDTRAGLSMGHRPLQGLQGEPAVLWGTETPTPDAPTLFIPHHR
jgi:hypothetical protein